MLSPKHILCIFFIYKIANGCLYPTFNNTSVTVVGIRRPFNTIDGCFGPEKNLEKVSLIQILNESVPVLYEDAFNNLDHLLDIIMENDGIKEIKVGAFKNLPKLYSIRLKNNEIKEIRSGIFNNLSLLELSLINNTIETIETSAFDDLPNLSIILLGHNKLSTWDSDWFRRSPKITELNFENNLIEKLPSEAFKNIRSVHMVKNLNVSTNILLNDNKIQNLDDGVFEGLQTLGWLFLQRNNIDVFNEKSLGSLNRLDWLRLEHNNLDCIPEKLFQIAPNIKYYLDGNPLTEDCVRKFNITARSNGVRIHDSNV